MSEERIPVTGVGAVTPVGLSAPASAAALRAGVSRLKELATFAVDGVSFGKAPVVGGRVPTEWFRGGPVEWEWPAHERFERELPPEPERLVAPGSERPAELAAHAAGEAWVAARLSESRPNRIGLYLGLGEGEPAGAAVDAVRKKLDARFAPVIALPEGRAAGLLALAAARADILEGKVDAALVGGADSLIREPVLERLDAMGILRSTVRPVGVIPGEAAAFAVLESSAVATRRDSRVLGQLITAASAKEPTAGTDEPNRAEGLTRVFHQIVRSAPQLGPPALVVCDMNGDRARAVEWSFALMRALTCLEGQVDLRHPADCIGDVGAASGLVSLLLALTAFTKSYAPGRTALIWGASDGATRAALALDAPEPGGG